MRIRKWYLDCISGDGTVFIGYAGTLGFGPVRVPVASFSLYPATGGIPLSRWRLASSPPSLERGERVRWEAPALGVRGAWAARSGPVSRLLLATPELRVEWRCHLPRAWARLDLGDHALEGWGYVEEMVVEGDVRRLPIRELHWGRFLSESDHLVWLSWKGPRPLTVLLRNGSESRGTVERDAVTLDDGGRLPLPPPGPATPPAADSAGELLSAATLGLDQGVRTLADQRVGDAFFPSLPPLRWVLPRILSGLRERKLAGRGRFERGSGRQAGEGWLLYETVEFP